MKRWAGFWLAMLVVCAATAADAPLWRTAAPGYVWEFPRDLAAHPGYKTEWWYITGHLTAQDDPMAEPMGYQLTFFRIGLEPRAGREQKTAWDPNDLVMAHAAVTDPATGTHTFSEVIWRTAPFLGGFGAPGDTTLAWCRAPAGTDADWKLEFDGATLRLRARDDAGGLRYDLRCTPSRPVVLHGQNGFSPKTGDGKSGSLYFSHTRMITEGEVYREGRPVKVRGRSWLDREIFTSTLAAEQKGWDWLAVGLKDGRDLMLYRLRDQKGAENFALGTLVAPDGAASPLPGDHWDLEPLEWWTSPETESRYPVKWKLSVPGSGLTLLLQAVLPDQENVSQRTGIHYWEGAVTVHPWENPGTLLGRGFVELTGYGEGSRPPV
jgi:predicted secreted hydrolase